jgi:predicted O-methyltransferase YrrM
MLKGVLSGTASALKAHECLPPSVASFRRRAVRRAIRLGDIWSLWSTLPLKELSKLLELSRTRNRCVELGTGTGWTALALALNDSECTVVTFDPRPSPFRDQYFQLVESATRERVRVVVQRGETPPPVPFPVELLFIDSLHEPEAVCESFRAWENRLSPDATVVFDDYDNPSYPGVRRAVETLELSGERFGRLFIWSRAGR